MVRRFGKSEPLGTVMVDADSEMAVKDIGDGEAVREIISVDYLDASVV